MTTSPAAIPLAALIPTSARPCITATRLRHVWPLIVMAIKGRAGLQRRNDRGGNLDGRGVAEGDNLRLEWYGRVFHGLPGLLLLHKFTSFREAARFLEDQTPYDARLTRCGSEDDRPDGDMRWINLRCTAETSPRRQRNRVVGSFAGITFQLWSPASQSVLDV